MKVKLEFEIETYPNDNQEFMDFIEFWADEQELILRHKIKLDYTNDDLDEIFVKTNIEKI